MKLLSGTPPANIKLLSGTLLANNKLLSGTPFWPITSCGRTCYWPVEVYKKIHQPPQSPPNTAAPKVPEFCPEVEGNPVP